MVRKGLSKKLVAEIFGVSSQTVWKWCKRAKRCGRESFKDLPRKPKKGKITGKVEAAIVALRTTLGWGTALLAPRYFRRSSTSDW